MYQPTAEPQRSSRQKKPTQHLIEDPMQLELVVHMQGWGNQHNIIISQAGI